MKTNLLLLISICFGTSLMAQTWSNSPVSGTWSDPQNWNSGIPTGSNQIILAGTTPTTMTNDLTLTMSSQLVFPSGSAARVISGSTTMTFGGGSKLENNSSVSQTIGFPIAISTGQSAQFTSNSGNIVLTGGVTLNSGGAIETQVTGSHTVDILSAVTGDGTLKAINNGNINFGTGGSMTGGTLLVQGSTVTFSGDGHLSATTHVKLSNGAKFDIGNQDLTVRSIEFENGDQIITLGGTLTIAGGNGAPNSSTQPASGTITGNGSIVKEGSETLILQGQQQFTGSITINGGTVELATMNANANSFKPASIIVGSGATLSVTQNMFINGLTLQDGAIVNIAPGVTLTPTNIVANGQYTINGGGTLNGNVATQLVTTTSKKGYNVYSTNGTIYINHKATTNEVARFEVYSTNGKLIGAGSISNADFKINRTFSKGVYVVKVKTTTESFSTKAVVK